MESGNFHRLSVEEAGRRGGCRGSGLCCVLALVVASALLPAGLAAQRLPIRAYSTVDGLPWERVNHILRDDRGWLWLATPLGLARFDGERFETVGEENLGEATALHQDRDGALWVGTARGLYRFDPGAQAAGRHRRGAGDGRLARRFLRYDIGGSYRSNHVLSLFEDREGRLWVGTRAGLFLFSKAKDRCVRVAEIDGEGVPRPLAEEEIMALTEDAAGRLWVGGREGLFVRRPGQETQRWVDLDFGGSIVDLLVDTQGRLWIATGRALRLCPAELLGTILGSRGLRSEDLVPCPPTVLRGEEARLCAIGIPGGEGLALRVASLLEGRDGTIWAAPASGLLRISPETATVEHFDTDNGLPPSVIRSLAEDGSGNLWMGTSSSGAARLASTGFVTFGPNSGLTPPALRIFTCPDRRLYFSVGYRKIYRLEEGGQVSAVTPRLPSVLRRRRAQSNPNMLCDSRGAWWVRTDLGVLRMPPVRDFAELATTEPEAFFRSGQELTDAEPFYLYEDSRGDVWITYRSGPRPFLSRWDRASDRLVHFTEDSGLPPDSSPASVVEDGHGTIWVGLSEGLLRIAGDEVSAYEGDEELPPGRLIPLFADRGGRLWLRTETGTGLLQPAPPGVEGPGTYSDVVALRGYQAFNLAEDAAGRVYAATRRGILRLDPETEGAEVFGRAAGVPSLFIYDLKAGPDGEIWVATPNGVARFTPGPRRRQAPVPEALITALRIDDLPVPVSDLGEREVSDVVLRSSQSRLRVDLSAIDFEPGRQILFRHRLGGGDSRWSLPVAQRSLLLAGLSSGRYRLEVEGVVNGRSGPPAVLSFEVLAPFWRRPWFLGMALLLALGALLLWHRLSLRRALAVERVRTRIATDLHDDLGSGLARISILAEVARRQAESGDPGESLDRIGESARELIDAMADIVWTVDPAFDDLPSLITRLRRFGTDLAEGGESGFVLRVVGETEGVELGTEQRRHLWLILKEALHNALRHARASRVEVEVEVRPRRLGLRVLDDGVGFDPERLAAEPGDGNGLRNLRRRAQALNGDLELRSAPGEGTRLRIWMPR